MPRPAAIVAFLTGLTLLLPPRPASATTIYLPSATASEISPWMIRASQVQLADDQAIGDFLCPIIVANDKQPGDQSYADFAINLPAPSTCYLWARLRYPGADGESFTVRLLDDAASPRPEQVLGGARATTAWHWDSQSDPQTGHPAATRVKLDLPAGKSTLRISARRASATVFFPIRWRQAEPLFNPRLNLLCLTDDPAYTPNDEDARKAADAAPRLPVQLTALQPSLPPVNPAALKSTGKKLTPDWMRCPRWYTKDSWREELLSRHPGDIAALVRAVAANSGQVLRLSVFWGGDAYFQSKVAPHAPRLGSLDYLREAVDQGRKSGIKIIAYMNPNALSDDHPLFPKCAIRAADASVSTRKAYNSLRGNDFYACINHPAYRKFLRDLLTEIFSVYGPDGLYVDGLTPHLCFCDFCKDRYQRTFNQTMPVEKFAKLPGTTVWSEMGRDPQPMGDVENDPDARRLTQMFYESLCEITKEFTTTVKAAKPDAITTYHTHPKAGCEDAYDATLTEVYLKQPWVHIAWRCGELAGYTNAFSVPALFNVYPHDLFTPAEARYKAFQGLANGTYPNFWSTPGMQAVFDFMAANAQYLDFATTTPLRFLAMPRDIRSDASLAAAKTAPGVSYGKRDRFIAPGVGAYAALLRTGLPVVNLHRPHFEEQLSSFKVLLLPNISVMSEAQVTAVREFVRNGGGLIATHETSLCDARGQRLNNFALADVLGVSYIKTLPATARKLELTNARHELTNNLTRLPRIEDGEPHVWVEPDGAAVVAHVSGDDAAGKIPAILFHNYGKGRVVYLPGRLDSAQCYELSSSIERLFADAVSYVTARQVPVRVDAGAPVGVTAFEQPGRWVIHLVNHDRDPKLASDACKTQPSLRCQILPRPGKQISSIRRMWKPANLPIHNRAIAPWIELHDLEEYEMLVVDWK